MRPRAVGAERATSCAALAQLDARTRERVAACCARHHATRLAVFGSALRGALQPDSDLDILVEFEPGHTPGLAFFAMQDELSQILGRRVDLNTPGFLSRYFRADVLAEAETLHAA